MKKYVVGVSTFEFDITLVEVLAVNEVMALVNSIWNAYAWDIRLEPYYKEDVDEIINLALQGDVIISKPLLINNNI